ncbi:DUF1777-domain-containing protein [Xylona heveae TC161]|uniref:DUF1777-domain-containing protein n=1 Tax=Xylona heveae (strain CBS 132557 / TC161) TaxID=1328760 RepID=A0A165FU28_XYLHT|nr:DUF1777-domain-containing protein [Xylona heveae TC161]KZF21382.1 DUF1777-domain-containing protein [Xylona heveae TC161]
MAEPPSKRSRRTDSTAMWDRNDSGPKRDRDLSSRDRDRDERDNVRDRRYRSRSRDRYERRRERSASRERYGGRGRDAPSNRDVRTRDRSLSRERLRSRRDEPARGDSHRNRSRSPRRRDGRARSRSPRQQPVQRPRDGVKVDGRRGGAKSGPSAATKQAPDADRVNLQDVDINADQDSVEAQMKAVMGFGGFKTTKNTKVPGNDIYMVRKEKKTEYRQYMNRVGGFNRPLSPS